MSAIRRRIVTAGGGAYYRRTITISGAGTPSDNYDVLLVMDSSTFNYAHLGKVNGGDMRFTDPSSVNCLYFIEEMYSLGKTYVWIRVPTAGTTWLYWDYGNAALPDGFEAFSGRAYCFGDEDSFTGWDEATELATKYPKGASSAGSTGGSEAHTHGVGTWAIADASLSALNTNAGTGKVATLSSTHGHNPAVTDPVETKNHEPPWIKTLAFKYASGKVPRLLKQHLWPFFDASPASGSWTRESAWDGLFPKVCSVASGEKGNTGGNVEHNHACYTNSYTLDEDRTGTSISTMNEAHNHTTYTPNLTVTFPYLDMLVYSADSDNDMLKKIILMFSALPPLGWDRFTALDAKYPRANSPYGGSSAGSNLTHAHTPNTPTGNATTTNRNRAGSTSGYYSRATSHNHTCSGDLDNATIDLPYYTMVYGKRKDPSVSTSYGAEGPGP